MSTTVEKFTRWRYLDNLLSEGKPLLQKEIFRAYQCNENLRAFPMSEFESFNETDKEIRLRAHYLESFRNDIVEFKRALSRASKNDATLDGMLIIGRWEEKKSTRTYCYRDKGFRIIPYLSGSMSEAEYNRIVRAVERLEDTVSNYDELRFSILSRIEADYISGDPSVVYEDNRNLRGREFRPVIYGAIKDRKILHIHYKKYSGDELEFDFHPYLLKQYNERWFLFGRKEGSRDPYTSLPLDRITTYPQIVGSYTEQRPAKYTDFFKKRVGVSRRKGERKTTETTHILIRISDLDAWGRITTKPLQTLEIVSDFDQKTNSGLISLDVIPNIDLYTKILSWGEGVEIIEDETVRSEFVALLKKISGKYPEM